jgi:hypothetical protein
MPNQIHQMQLRFVATEDRLLFRISTTEHLEFQFWFTRRYVKFLWQALQHMLAQSYADITQSYSPQVQDALRSFQHEQAIHETDFSSDYEEAADRVKPLGDTPILLSQIQVKPSDDHTQLLCLHPENGHGLEIAMGTPLQHSFIQLLVDALNKSDWDLPYLKRNEPSEKPTLN